MANNHEGCIQKDHASSSNLICVREKGFSSEVCFFFHLLSHVINAPQVYDLLFSLLFYKPCHVVDHVVD